METTKFAVLLRGIAEENPRDMCAVFDCACTPHAGLSKARLTKPGVRTARNVGVVVEGSEPSSSYGHRPRERWPIDESVSSAHILSP